MIQPWAVVLIGACLSPFVTWLPMLAHLAPSLGLPAYPFAQGIDLWHAQAFYLVGLVTVALVIRGGGFAVKRGDEWLALAVSCAGFTVFWRGARMDPTHTFVFALGALLLVAVKAAPASAHETIRRVVVVLGAIQALYMLHQWLGYDVLWLRFGDPEPKIQMLGTLGTVDAASAYVAIVTPLMPLWLMPLGIAAVALSHSGGAICALGLGLAFYVVRRYRMTGWQAMGFIFTIASTVAWVYRLCQPTKSATSAMGRIVMGDFGARVWWQTANPFTGWGLGGWKYQVVTAQQASNFLPTKELWAEAHNEYLQWFTEVGVLGFALLILWLWQHRAMFSSAWAGAVAALSVESLTFFPFHVVSVALLGILVIGCAASSTHRPLEATS